MLSFIEKQFSKSGVTKEQYRGTKPHKSQKWLLHLKGMRFFLIVNIPLVWDCLCGFWRKINGNNLIA